MIFTTRVHMTKVYNKGSFMKYFLASALLILSACGDAKFILGQVVEINSGFYKGCYVQLADYQNSNSTYSGYILSCPNSKSINGSGLHNVPESDLSAIPIERPSPLPSSTPSMRIQ